jgi:nicotinic acid mononucleotide adenylyltransferase
VFLKYSDKDEGKRAYVFFYPSQDRTYMFEADDSSQNQLKELEVFEDTICQLLYIIHRNKKPTEPSQYRIYCMETSKELIFKSKNLYFIIGQDDIEV